jgi:threonine/homoserine/homoserine lactone efflux protein
LLKLKELLKRERYTSRESNVIYFVGSIYIIFKGFQTVTSKSSTKEKVTNSSAFLTGFQVNLLNPKMWVFYLTVLPIYMTAESGYFLSLIYLGLITILINFIADITYAYTSDFFFKNSSETTKDFINKVSGVSPTFNRFLFIRQQVFLSYLYLL